MTASAKCYVYVIKSGKKSNSPVKIGMSDNPLSRIKSLQTGNPERLTLKYTLECRDRKHAEKLERLIHSELSGSNVLGEWFKPRRSEFFKTLMKYCEPYDYAINIDVVEKTEVGFIDNMKNTLKQYKKIILENERIISERKLKIGRVCTKLREMGLSWDEINVVKDGD